ncbi:bifunctional 6-phosphofructo-2-kinase/fructose-2,6-bisphosphate 2-phosphatase [Ramicandelaber brevisporus]|nr:bifunctional 6-phosphofructo-2-kinase/fructose-2,6-bisphosphate 2-phosphatase [Ramicandelaber brevisporus]
MDFALAHTGPHSTDAAHCDGAPKLIVVMVGTPASGKSYISKKLKRYLNWLGFQTHIFNVGNRRRFCAQTDPFHHDAQTSSSSQQQMQQQMQQPQPQQQQQSLDQQQQQQQQQQPKIEHDHHFFDPDNSEAKKYRDELAMGSLEDAIEWLYSGGQVAIHDATNSTVQRRKMIRDRVAYETGFTLLFVESICEDERVLRNNFRLKLSGPDYIGVDPNVALEDFKARYANYKRAYQAISDQEESEDVSYCKIINVGKKIISHNIQGYLASHVVFYLMNMNLARRRIWITRHGESDDNVAGRIGGDAALSENGHKFAQALARFIDEQRRSDSAAGDITEHTAVVAADTHVARQAILLREKALDAGTFPSGISITPSASVHMRPVGVITNGISSNGNRNGSISKHPEGIGPLDRRHSHLRHPPPYIASATTRHILPPSLASSPTPPSNIVTVWTSMLRRSIETGTPLDRAGYDIRHLRALNEIYAGDCEGLTYAQIEQKFPDVYNARRSDKLNYRYPGMGGESYRDVVQRLGPLIIELERMTTSVLIITHRAMSRVLLAYLLDIPLDQATNYEVPLSTVFCLEPRPFGNSMVRYRYDADLDTFILDSPATPSASAATATSANQNLTVPSPLPVIRAVSCTLPANPTLVT